MPADMSRKQEQKGTGRILGWGALLALILFLGLLAFFLFATNGGPTSTWKRTPEQNVGQGNAPADTRPSPGVQKDSSGNYKLPNQ
ncbi:MAG: hypothetical protein E5W43_30475 [Mesorhizobium sp.]|nr:MAG: hypothetical protein E5W43_30475 [Mesorhizobium sp.]